MSDVLYRVLIGRSVIYGLTIKGESGLKQVIEMRKNELELPMALARKHWTGEILREGSRTGLRPTRNQRVQPPHGSDPTKDFEKQPSSFPSLPGPKAEIHTLTPEIP
ncbi:hypothetical protein FXO38_00350 [Capsicum annuum]|uniref:FMN-dependent dehydrogenase domain-containing protein n=1 Tax=Capsicum annuum TaxID=4072 RepID=A0A2G2Y5L9_CAPAN|nr:hypothetical protein FXO38_00350 [Capsicum annuum]PHT65057.1 hypothetical protein T459_29482 [Capsicum annuum]